MVILMDGTDTSRARWCILRTSGGRTLPLAASLTAAAIEAWSPKRTLKRPIPGRRPEKNGRRPTTEVDAPIIPTFVFARAQHLHALAAIADDPASQHPAFSIFRHAGRVPLIGDREVTGLQEEERAAALLIQQIRECETREEQRRLRAAAMRTERERRKAMRAELRDLRPGQHVTVNQMPALAGLTGVVQSSDGRSAVVSFNGMLTMKIEAWQLLPTDVFEPAVLSQDIAA